MFDIQALRTECQSARVLKIKSGGLNLYGAEPFETAAIWNSWR